MDIKLEIGDFTLTLKKCLSGQTVYMNPNFKLLNISPHFHKIILLYGNLQERIFLSVFFIKPLVTRSQSLIAIARPPLKRCSGYPLNCSSDKKYTDRLSIISYCLKTICPKC